MGDHPGGIARLHAVLRDHRWTLEADLLRFFRVDLLDLHRGRLSWRRLLVLYRALPPDSTTSMAEHNGFPPMTRTEWLLDEVRRDQMAIGTRGELRPEAMPGSPFHLTDEQKAALAEAKAAENRRRWDESLAREAARQEALARQEDSP